MCTNRYVYQYTTPDSTDNQVDRTKEVTEEVEAGDERILEEKTILSGSYSGHEVAFEVPRGRAPRGRGEMTNVEWKIRVTVVIRGAPDVIEKIPLAALSTSESYANWAESAPYLDLHGVCDMEFRLPGRSFRLGERIEGTLVVTPRRDFGARTLRVELVRVEAVPRDSVNYSETVQAGEVDDESPRYQSGSSRAYAFAMDVPEAAGSCLETEQTFVALRLRAMMNRRMAYDPELQPLLNV